MNIIYLRLVEKMYSFQSRQKNRNENEGEDYEQGSHNNGQ